MMSLQHTKIKTKRFLKTLTMKEVLLTKIAPLKELVDVIEVAQIPKVVLDGVKGLKDEVGDSDELDNEAVVKAYVNIVTGVCISLELTVVSKFGSQSGLSFVDLVRSLKGTRGSDYLHTSTGTKQGVIHRDVNSSNILLDANYATKISDFGLAKVGPTNQKDTFVNTGVKGTFGYMDPMYFYTNKLTRKSDVYALVSSFEACKSIPVYATNKNVATCGNFRLIS
ncbi:putative receptor-like protein kinase [Tanacetum coccineum]